MEWFRLYNEFATDPKLLSFTKSERYDVVTLLCLASSSQERGTLLLDDEDLAACLQLTIGEFGIFCGRLIKKAVLERTPEGWLRFVHWELRQPKSDSAAGRMQQYRARQKTNAVRNGSDDCSGTLRNGDVTVTDREEQSRVEKNRAEENARADAARTTTPPLIPHSLDDPPIDRALYTSKLLGFGASRDEIAIAENILANRHADPQKYTAPYMWTIIRDYREEVHANSTAPPAVMRHEYQEPEILKQRRAAQ